MALLSIYYIFRLESAIPVYSVLPITIEILAFGLALPITVVSVFITSFIVIGSNFAFTTSTLVSVLTIFSFSFCVTFIIVPTVCTGIGIFHFALLSTVPTY